MTAYILTFIGGLMVGSAIYNLFTRGARIEYVACGAFGFCLAWLGLTA